MFFLIFSFACKQPIEAPNQLESLCAFLFANHSLTEESEMGIQNLVQWTEENEIHEDGYRIDNLHEEDLDNSDAPIGDLDLQMGVAILNSLQIPPEDLSYAISGLSPQIVAPETFLSAEREYAYGEECFWDYSCDKQAFYSNLEIAFPLGVVANGYLYSELMWVDTEYGMALLQRDWLLEEAQMNVNWIHIDAQYSLSAVIPIQNQNSLRLDSLWSVLRLGETPVDSDIGMSLLVGKSQKTIEEILIYLDEQE